ncbi:hypothetical protein MRB53_034362 [Persea americana]|uniref:Uncharacterized protein n=1 Tax=Persea americana TaxID=3435 RepID=A0ACC2KYC1_PERAE|nr:hypothetical protein MRB53_034362 [Persea americana]
MKLKAKQVEELGSLGYTNSNGKEKGDLNHLLMAISGVSVSGQGDPSKPSKSVKRSEKRAQQEETREQRIQEEQINTISDRSFPNVELGKEYKSESGSSSSNPSIMLSYHGHAFGLGEHFLLFLVW